MNFTSGVGSLGGIPVSFAPSFGGVAQGSGFTPTAYAMQSPGQGFGGGAGLYSYTPGVTSPPPAFQAPSFTNTMAPDSWNLLAAQIRANANPNLFAGGNAGAIYAAGQPAGGAAAASYFSNPSLFGGNSSAFGAPAYGVGQGWALGLGPQYGSSDFPLSSFSRSGPSYGAYSPSYGAFSPQSMSALTDPGSFNWRGYSPGAAAYGVGGGWPNAPPGSLAYSLAQGVFGAESNYGQNRQAMSMQPNNWGSIGPMQITPGTARQYGLPAGWNTNPQANMAGGQSILSSLLNQYNGNPWAAAAAYNSGQPNPYSQAHPQGLPNATVANYVFGPQGVQQGMSQYGANFNAGGGPYAPYAARSIADPSDALARALVTANPQTGYGGF